MVVSVIAKLVNLPICKPTPVFCNTNVLVNLLQWHLIWPKVRFVSGTASNVASNWIASNHCLIGHFDDFEFVAVGVLDNL